MKLVPILVVTNALALGLAILLYFQQEDLKSQVGSARSTPVRRADAPVDTAELYDRLARLESRFASPGPRPMRASSRPVRPRPKRPPPLPAAGPLQKRPPRRSSTGSRSAG